MEIRFKKLVPEAKTPVKTYDVDAGFDLFAVSVEETPDYIQYNTGIAFEIPEGFVGLVFPRSSITKYNLMLKNCVGVIDASYRGEIICRFFNTKVINYNVGNKNVFIDYKNSKIYKIGERIAQIVFLELPKITLIEAEELSETQRGSGGFGHTGK